MRGRTWFSAGAINRHLVYFNDDEASDLSEVPKPSLRLLQAQGLVTATQAPMSGGGFKRVWHLPEVVAASILENFKRASGTDYRTAAAILQNCSLATRALFAASCSLTGEVTETPIFAPSLLVVENALVAIRADATTRDILSRALDKTAAVKALKFDCDLALIAIKDGDAWEPITARTLRAANKKLLSARFSTSVHLGNLFRDLEVKSTEIRT
ncbi:hypothetical protein [Bradyrhizobium elkanii]|uniref:Uncharacterized protein n=1 Tax=Bradyrhizobium elkanii TaxID=29448 RepID=A0A8I1YFT1_BRAEL|nr:hypothetical protein [Bradyrhizobium elkanii]MBP1297401.1 hypothetical protein [Bradyrhizobium elkanii]